MNRRMAWLCSVLLVSGLQAASMAHAQHEMINNEAVRQRLDEAKTRLKLTDEQVEAIRPLAMREAEKLRAIRAKYGEDPSRRDKYNMFREAKTVAASFNAGMEKILTADQMRIWKEMQAEARQELIAEYQRRSGGQ